MALKSKDSNGRIQLVAAESILGVVLETSILENTVRVRPTNTTATINIVAGTGAVTQDERDASKLILLHNGPHGGFTQGGALGAGSYLVNDVVAALITNV